MANETKQKKTKRQLPGGKNPQMQKFTRRPLFWIVVAIVVVTIFGQISSSSNQFTKIETSQAMAAITRGDVEAAEIVDRDQVIKLEIGRAHV